MFKKFLKHAIQIQDKGIFISRLTSQYIIPLQQYFNVNPVYFLRIVTLYNIGNQQYQTKRRVKVIDEYLLEENGDLTQNCFLYNRDNEKNQINAQDDTGRQQGKIIQEEFVESKIYDAEQLDNILHASQMRETKQLVHKGVRFQLANNFHNKVEIYTKYDIPDDIEAFNLQQNFDLNSDALYDKFFESQLIPHLNEQNQLTATILIQSTNKYVENIDEDFIRIVQNLLQLRNY